MEGEGGSQVEFKFTLQEIKDSIPSDVLRSLYKDNFKPNDLVIIKKKTQRSKFVEDLYFRNKKKRRKPKQQLKNKKPSEIFEDDIPRKSHQPTTVKSVLGVYFKLYKKLFQEEDSEWNSKNIQKAEMLINSLLEDTETSTMEVMTYVKRLMPLWRNRLANPDIDFPDRRPSLRLLFNGKRWYWSNRRILYRQWE